MLQWTLGYISFSSLFSSGYNSRSEVWSYGDFIPIFFMDSLYCLAGEGNGNPLQYSCLENPVDEEPDGLLSMVSHRVRHDWNNLACMHALEEMATHSSILAWRIPGIEEPGGLLSMGSHSQTRLKQLSSSSSTLSCIVALSLYIPTNSARAFLFLHDLSRIYCL